MGSRRMLASAVTSLEKPCPNGFWARVLRSPTLEDSEMEGLSLQPLVKSHSVLNRVFPCFPEISALHATPTHLGLEQRRKKTPHLPSSAPFFDPPGPRILPVHLLDGLVIILGVHAILGSGIKRKSSKVATSTVIISTIWLNDAQNAWFFVEINDQNG